MMANSKILGKSIFSVQMRYNDIQINKSVNRLIESI